MYNPTELFESCSYVHMLNNEHFKMNKLSESTCLEETDSLSLISHWGSAVLYLVMGPSEIFPIHVERSSGIVILGDHITLFFLYELPLDTFFFV